VTIPRAHHGEVSIAYESLGGPDGSPLLLIPGMGAQMLDWPDGFCRILIDHGFDVARFDNRDCGLSTHFTTAGVPGKLDLLRRPGKVAPYELSDMAGDALCVMDALGWSRSHVVGVSLGGMIAQTIAIEYPERVLSLTSVSSTPWWRIGRPSIRAMLRIARVTKRDVANAEEAAQLSVDLNRIVASPGFDLDEAEIRSRARLAYERETDRHGIWRQLAAITASDDRRAALGRLDLPALVLHGEQDVVFRMQAGRATAEAIPGARFRSFPGMGHDLPRELWPQIAGEIRSVADHAPAR